YTINLIRSLSKIDSENSYYLLFYGKKRKNLGMKKIGIKRENFVPIVLPFSLFSIPNQILLPLYLKKNEIDIYYAPNYMVPLIKKPCAFVITVHDIIPLKFPEFTPKSKKTRLFWLYKLIMKRIVKIADVIISDSKKTKRDIIKYFYCSNKNICTVYPGIDSDFFNINFRNKGKDFKKQYNISDNLVLYVGRQDPYKNLLNLVKAFRKMVDEDCVRAKLIIVGPEDERYPEVRLFIKQYNLTEKIIFSGYLSKSDLVSIYHQADLLILPSKYEGFGLPIIEAFACKTPVVASNRASIPEVVGNAGILFNPESVNEIRNAMKSILKDGELAQSLVEKGQKRLDLFSWNKSGGEILGIFENVYEKKKEML
ncbi:glycosyltransferase family 4 protein, partial [Chlamydiota bacterium]